MLFDKAASWVLRGKSETREHVHEIMKHLIVGPVSYNGSENIILMVLSSPLLQEEVRHSLLP